MSRRMDWCLNWFRVPWHTSGSSPRDVLKLIVNPLCTSLLTCCLSLNVLIYILVNSHKFSELTIAFSYASSICSSASFIIYVLSIVYCNFFFILVATILQALLAVSSIGVLVNFWLMSLGNGASMVFNIVKYVVTFLSSIMLLFQFRLFLVSTALGFAMFAKGNAWDLDDLDTIDTHFKAHTILVH